MTADALEKIGYGLYIVSSGDRDRMNGQIANVVFQVTAEPPMIAVGINKRNLTHELIEKHQVFTVSVLSQDTPVDFIRDFGFRTGRDHDKFADIAYDVGTTGAPMVTEHAIACLEAKVVNRVDCGTHTVFVGKVVAGRTIQEGEPMTYAYYKDVKGGKTAKTAPTYIARGKKTVSPKGGGGMSKYRCTVCGYVYDPQKGDPDNGVQPGTPFEDVPADWLCPVCGAGKQDFEKVEE